MNKISTSFVSNGVQENVWITRQQIGRGRSRVIVRGTGKTQSESFSNFQRNLNRKLDSLSNAHVPQQRNTALDSPTLKKWLDECCVIKRAQGRQESSIHKFRRSIENHVLPHLNKPIARITSNDVHDLFENRLNDAGTSARKHCFEELRNMFNLAVKRQEIPASPMFGMEKPKHETVVSEGDEKWIARRIQRFSYALDWIENPDNDLHHLYPRMLLMGLGLRRGELLGLTWDCVKLERGNAYINVKQQLSHDVENGGFRIVARTKNGKSRIVPLPERFRLALLEQQKFTNAIPREWVDAGFDPISVTYDDYERDVVFCSSKGRRITFNDHREDWIRFLTAYYNRKNEAPVSLPANEYFRPHATRHVSASMMFAANVPVETAMSILGHSDVVMTAYYTHVRKSAKRDAVESLADFIKTKK